MAVFLDKEAKKCCGCQATDSFPSWQDQRPHAMFLGSPDHVFVETAYACVMLVIAVCVYLGARLAKKLRCLVCVRLINLNLAVWPCKLYTNNLVYR